MMDAYLNEAPCGFIVFSDKGLITDANATIGNVLGFSGDELAGQKFEALMGIAGRIFFQTHFFPMLSLQGEATEIFLTLRGKDGTDVPVLVNAKRRTVDGITAFHCILMPVFHRKKYESELLQARKTAEDMLARNDQLRIAQVDLAASKISLDQRITQLSKINEDLARFSKVISHDMQEPVRKIAMFADVISREIRESDPVGMRHAVTRITTASNRLRSLINCIDQYVGVDISQRPRVPCDLKVLIEAARIRASAARDGAYIEITASELPVVPGKTDQLELLFYELMLNAVQFRKPGAASTHIRIRADIIQQNSYLTMKDKYRYVDYARIVFSDSGQGFLPELSEYIFQLFKTAHDEGAGLGFGLALCGKIVSNHFGSITAASEPGRGASFTILLPLHTEMDGS